jgi:hypothetical protein
MEVKQICKESECDNKPVTNMTIGNGNYNFCCQKGFEKSLNEFTKFLGKKK